MYCEVLLIQHALTQWNVDKRKQGHNDTSLNNEGRMMSKILAYRLKNEKIHALYSSDLRRAYETLDELSKILGLPVIKDLRLREGRWRDQEKSNECEILPFVLDSETDEDVSKRMLEAMNEIAGRHMGQRIVVVSHGGAIKAFLKNVLDEDTFKSYKGIRTAINCLRYYVACNIWSCVYLNDDMHLKSSIIEHCRIDAG
mgnify:CR=1 FL=1